MKCSLKEEKGIISENSLVWFPDWTRSQRDCALNRSKLEMPLGQQKYEKNKTEVFVKIM